VNLKRYFRLSVLLLAVVGLAACNNSYGIFSSIQGESKNTNTSAFYQTAVRNMVPFGGRYYAQLVGIYSRPAASSAGSDWAYLENSAFGSDYVCRGIAANGSLLYAAISNGRGSTSTPKGIFSFNGSTWTQEYSGSADIQALYLANGALFVITKDSTSDSGSTYSVSYLSGTSLMPCSGTLSTMPTNVVYVAGTIDNFFFASGSTLYSAASLPSTFASVSGIPSVSITCLATNAFNYSDAATALFLGTSTGYVYRSTDGSSWEGPQAASSGTSYAVTTMLAVPTGTTGSGRALLVGNSLSGYYEADVTSSLGSFTTGGSSTIVTTASVYESSLTNMPVFAFVYDGTATSGTLFACASATAVDYTGLWSNKRTTTWAGWASE